MAKLHRLVKLDDRQNTHVLTFILPISIGADVAKDIISSEFSCGFQKWNIKLSKGEKDSHIGAYLTLKNATAGVYVTADYGFTMLNRGHYTQNESFTDTAKVFTKHQPTHGRKSFISVSEVKNSMRGFVMEKEQLYLEVTLSNFKTHFEYQLQLPMTDKDRQRYPPNDLRLETGLFPFNSSEWQVNLKINEKNPTDVRGGSVVTLRRLSNCDHYCKFRYRIHIGVIELTPLPGTKPPVPSTQYPVPAKTSIHSQPVNAKNQLNPAQSKVIRSNEMDSLFIDADTQEKLVLPTNIYRLATMTGVITIKIECLQAITLTLLQIPMDRNRHRAMRCYDRDKQAWLFEAHMKSDKLKFYVFYGDIATVPRGCLRMMNIGVGVLPAYGNVKLVKALNSPYTKLYVQRPQDDFGLEIPTNIQMKDIIDTKSVYIYDNTNSLTVQIEWGDSYLLKDTEYTMTDNISRLHKIQMSKEMGVLQRENLILEKQVHSYQTTIAQKDSKGEYDPNQVATRPQPPGQAQHGYGDPRMDIMHMQDPYNYRGANMPPNQMGMNQTGAVNLPYQPNSQYPTQANMGGHPSIAGLGVPGSAAQNHVGYDTAYNRNELSIPNDYDQQGRGYAMDAGGIPVPADRGPRSRSADPRAVTEYISPVAERRSVNRRKSTTGAEYADYLEQSPNSRYNRNTPANIYDGYRSDSGYRSETMSKPNDPRYNEHYSKESNRPRPSMRTGKPSDSRSDFGDYYSESRSRTTYDRDIDASSDRSHKLSSGKTSSASHSARGQPVGENRRNNMLNSTTPTGRASYAGYESDHTPFDNRAGSSYPNTPRSSNGQRGTGGYPRPDDRRLMENGPR